VPDDVLQPRDAWVDGAAYDASAAKLAEMFRANFEQFTDQVSDAVKAAGPR
jgi:phosphoenolpyruvate carboxykinase (ATP)